MGINITLVGDKELEKALARLPQKLQKLVVTQAMMPGAELIRRTAMGLINIGPAKVKGGHLRDFLHIKTMSKKGFLGVQVRTGTRRELGISSKDRYYYPAAVELGTDFMPAHPYLRPATNNNRDKILGLFRVTLRLGLSLD